MDFRLFGLYSDPFVPSGLHKRRRPDRSALSADQGLDPDI